MLNALVADADRGRVAGISASFRQLSQQWLPLAAHDLSPTTIRRYNNLLSQRILPALGDRSIHNIRTNDLDSLYLGLADDVGLAPATVRQVHAVIRRAFRQAVRWGWIATKRPTAFLPPAELPKQGTRVAQKTPQRSTTLCNSPYWNQESTRRHRRASGRGR
ncbi:MAG: phage integrase central domain-containing protein [Acidimicrobiales bacterium]